MGITEDVPLKEASVDADQALGIQRPAHVVDVCFACAIQSCEVAPSQGIEHPGERVVWVLFEESLESLLGLGVVFVEIRVRGIEGRRLFEAMLVVGVGVAGGAGPDGGGVRVVCQCRRAA